MKFQLPQLPYGQGDLKPFLSNEQIEYHYGKHHKAYIDKVNAAIEDQKLGDITLEYIINNHDGKLFENAAQAWNHTFYWMGLTPQSSVPSASGKFADAVTKKFGSTEGLKTKFIESALAVFGSGWTWLVANATGQLDIVNTSNADNPIRLEQSRPLWTCDVWEHAYYVDYRNDRKEYLGRAWSKINWQFVEQNFNLEGVPNMTKLMTAQPAATAGARA